MEDQPQSIEQPEISPETVRSEGLSLQPPPPVRRASGTTPPQRMSDERVEGLVQALGDQRNPMHQQAEEELIAIGTAAVPALIAALQPDRPWLMSYRAAEALGQIGDGRASGPLIQALRHPNSNVRWSAVRALAEVGDSRAIWMLRQVARNDRGKTSWGESVAAAAQAALEQMQARSALWKLGNPAKTAVLFALTLAALIIAVDRVRELRAELTEPPNTRAFITPIIVTSTPDTGEEGTPDPNQTVEATPEATAESGTPEAQGIMLTVINDNANVRSGPGTQNSAVGTLKKDTKVKVLGVTPDGDWYQIEFQGKLNWISAVILSKPSQTVPTVTP